jgi:hypothetical protein
MADLVKELRNKGAMLLTAPPQPDDRLRAADEIERLRSVLSDLSVLARDRRLPLMQAVLSKYNDTLKETSK